MMTREPLIVEVLLVPLPPSEIDERRRRLRTLLLIGALRRAQEQQNSHQTPSRPGAAATFRGGCLQK
jgi:hypothetical protein